MTLILGIAIGVLMALVAVAGFGLYRRRQLNRMAPPFQVPSAAVLSVSTTPPPPLGAELQVRNEAGQIILQTREVARLPIEARRVGTDPVAIQRGQQLAADLFKGVSTLPGKTIEVVFDPKILQGLQGGVLEVMPAAKGGTYAIARNVETGRTAGQGRLIQGGGARQLAAGLFHLASIAVAQSHLADINRNLEDIKGLASDIKRHLMDKNLAELEGGLQYLHELAAMLGRLDDPACIPAEKRNQLEALRRKSLEWMALVRRQGLELEKKIASQKSRDQYGTGSTNEALHGLASEANDLVAMYQLVLQLSATIEACDTCIDPGRTFNPATTLTANGQDLQSVLSKMLGGFRDRTNILLGQALLNKNSTLRARRETLVRKQEGLLLEVQKCHSGYDDLLNALAERANRIQSSNEGARVLLSFDQHGAIGAVAID